MESWAAYAPRKVISALSAMILVGILAAGLWPFHSPNNEVYWLGDANGLRFGRHGTILSSVSFALASLERPSCSFEIVLKASPASNGGTILAFYNRSSRRQFSLQQSATDFVLQYESGDQYRPTSLYVDEVLREQQVLITVSSDGHRTLVYIDGKLIKRSSRFGLSLDDLTGQLIVANSALQSHSWSGQLRGLAIYKGELSAERVANDYQDWTRTGKPAGAESGGTVALYLFDERAGKIVHNHIGSGSDLYIPDRYLLVDQTFLEPPWKESATERGYLRNSLINTCAFIPLGVVFSAYFTTVRQIKHGAVVTLVLGASVSLTIEILQAYLPTRDSGVTDLITNTLGTCVGVALYRATAFPLARALVRSRWAWHSGIAPKRDSQ